MVLVSQLLVLAASAGLVYLLSWYLTSAECPKGLKPLPGPKGYPLLGSVLDFPKTFSYHKFTEWSRRYGKIYQVNILGKTHVVISDEAVANDLLALRGAHYSDRPRIVMFHELVTQSGNLGSSPQNKYWRNARRLMATLSSESTLEVWNPVLTNEAARLVDDLVADPANYEYLFERYSSVVMLRLLYGKVVPRNEESEHVNRIMTIVHTLERTGAPGAYIVDFLPSLKHLPSFLAPFKREAALLHNYEFSYFSRLYGEARENETRERAPDKPSQPLIDTYVERAQYWDLSDFEIKYCLGTSYEGGSGTTSAVMQSFCLAMWHYPDWQMKVQKEIDDVVGDRLPSFDDWPQLPTVRAAIKETMRWRPVVPGGIPHLATKDDSYNGCFIPKGAVIHGNVYAMFKDESVYPDAEQYNPDRWLDPNYPTFQAPLTHYPNLKRFSHFGFGRRLCPGLAVAERTLFIQTVMLMWVCSVDKKLDAEGKVIPVHWYDYRPGNNTGPQKFDFALKVRSVGRMSRLREYA